MSNTDELSKQDKIELLKAIQSGELLPEDLTHKSIVVCNGKNAWRGLMISVANSKAGQTSPVIYIGEAKAIIEECIANIKNKRNENSGPK
jgi:hypothetical protein